MTAIPARHRAVPGSPIRRRVVRGLTAVPAVALLVGVATGAAAPPTPEIGPTTGGTTVSVDCADLGFTAVDAGSRNALALSADGRIFTWGEDVFGALGGSGGTNYPAPIAQGEIPAGTRFVDGAVSQWGGYGLTDTGAVYSWGLNLSGELGNGSFPVVQSSASPVLVSSGAIPAGVTAVDVVAGSGNAGLIGSDGWAYTWGSGNSGINGDGTLAWRSTPVALAHGAIPAGVTVDQLAIGNSTGYVLGSDGWIYSWGYRGFGALGDGATGTTSQLTPIPVARGEVPTGVTFTQVSAGNNTAYGLGSDGNVYAWGQNVHGQLGHGTSGDGTEVTAPVLVSRGELPAGVTFVAVDADAGSEFAVATGSDGEFYSWGYGVTGGLGNGDTGNATTPVLVHQGTVPAAVTLHGPVVNWYSGYAIGDDGAMYSWGGIGQPYQLGAYATEGTTEPAFGAAFRITEVTFDGVPGTDLDASGCPVTVVTPPHAAGPVDVTVSAGLVAGPRDLGQWITAQTVHPGGFTYLEAPVITTPTLPNGTVGQDWSAPVEATGTGPLTFEVTAGTLPPGLVLDPDTGLITGIPTTAGTYPFTVSVRNAVGSDSHDYTVEIPTVVVPSSSDPSTTSPSVPSSSVPSSSVSSTSQPSGSGPATSVTVDASTAATATPTTGSAAVTGDVRGSVTSTAPVVTTGVGTTPLATTGAGPVGALTALGLLLLGGGAAAVAVVSRRRAH